MNHESFTNKMIGLMKVHPWRLGQTIYNILFENHPELLNELLNDNLFLLDNEEPDPFYWDEKEDKEKFNLLDEWLKMKLS